MKKEFDMYLSAVGVDYFDNEITIVKNVETKNGEILAKSGDKFDFALYMKIIENRIENKINFIAVSVNADFYEKAQNDTRKKVLEYLEKEWKKYFD